MADTPQINRRGFLGAGAGAASGVIITPAGVSPAQMNTIVSTAINALNLESIVSTVAQMGDLQHATMRLSTMDKYGNEQPYASATLSQLSKTLSSVDVQALKMALKALPAGTDSSFFQLFIPKDLRDQQEDGVPVSIDQYLNWLKQCHAQAQTLLTKKDEIVAKHNAFASLHETLDEYSQGYSHHDYYQAIEKRFRAGELSLQDIADPRNHDKLAFEAWREVELDYVRNPRISTGNKIYVGSRPCVKPEIEARWQHMVPPEEKIEHKSDLKLGGPFKGVQFYTRLFSDEYYLPVNTASAEVESAILALLALAGDKTKSAAQKPLFQENLLGVPTSHYLVLKKEQLEALKSSNWVWGFLERCNQPEAAAYTKELQQLIPSIKTFLDGHKSVLPEGDLPHRPVKVEDVGQMSFQQMTAHCNGNPPVLPHKEGFSARVSSKPTSSPTLS